MKPILLFLFTIVSSHTAWSYTCTIASLKAQFPQFCREQREARSLTEQQMRTLFIQTRGDLIELILQGRPLRALSAEERSIYNRISTVSFLGYENCPPDVTGKPLINASYNNNSHGVRFCRGLANFPLTALVGMIGHEIGHSADSCSSQSYLIYAENQSLLQFPERMTSVDSSYASGEFIEALRRTRGPVQFITKFMMHERDVVESWRGRPGIEFRAEPMPLSRYPLNQIRMCLTEQDNLWTPSNSDHVAIHSDKDPGCDTQSDFEGVADIWGAYALEKFLQRNPQIKGAQALGLFESRKPELCSIKRYPDRIAKLESIWLPFHAVAEALGCQLVEERSCMRNPPFTNRDYSSRVRQQGSQRLPAAENTASKNQFWLSPSAL